jgi:hypothetical protein
MNPGRIKHISLLVVLLLVSLAACTGTTVAPTVKDTTPISDATSISYALATPYAQQPAAGICASFDGRAVTVTINIDIPDPRCAIVKPEQTLTVLNNTQEALLVIIGRFSASLDPGEKAAFETPFGEYLAPGVHKLQVSPCCGAELWLEATK